MLYSAHCWFRQHCMLYFPQHLRWFSYRQKLYIHIYIRIRGKRKKEKRDKDKDKDKDKDQKIYGKLKSNSNHWLRTLVYFRHKQQTINYRLLWTSIEHICFAFLGNFYTFDVFNYIFQSNTTSKSSTQYHTL